MTTYVVEYCFCALAFLLVILWNCLTTRQFPGFSYRVFRTELFCSLVAVISDVVGAYTIPIALSIPHWVNQAVNVVYYVLQLGIPALLLLYVLALQGFRLREIPVWLFIPFFAGECIIVTNPLHGLLFYIDPALGYQHGVLFRWMYCVNVMYVVLAYIVLNVYRKRMNRKQYITISLFIALSVGAAAVQFLYPNILLSGPSTAISITMLYLTIQKPDDMLDVTTGVFNRTAMMQMVDNYVTEGHRFQATILVLTHIARLDRIMGYESLNRLMAEIGRFLTGLYPRSWVFRLSGSTLFVMLTRKDADYQTGLTRLRERFQNPWMDSEYNITLPVSILCLPRGEMLRSADEFSSLLNYAADQTPEQAEIVLDETALSEVNRRAIVENALTVALKEDLLEVYLQPIYDVKEQSFTRAEALVRLTWQGEAIPPSEFIPIAEQNGLILQIDDLVLRKVCAFLRDYDSLVNKVLTSVGVNLSAVQLMRPDLASEVERTLAEYGIEPGRIVFEITETAASGPLLETQKKIESMQSKGFSFALDDFGTGFANIVQVVQMPFDVVKLDRSILTGNGDGDSRSVLHSCIRMFKGLGVRIVAEGAETEQDVRRLKRLDVDFIQGFYYARPMQIDQTLAFLSNR